MDENELLARFGLVPIAADLAEVRGLIEALIADDKRDSNEPLKTLCIQLFSAGNPADALLIYKAKRSSFDAGCYIDIQLVCGAGLEPTKAFLCGSGEPKAKELLALLQDSSSAGDFDDFTPEKQLNFTATITGSPRSYPSFGHFRNWRVADMRRSARNVRFQRAATKRTFFRSQVIQIILELVSFSPPPAADFSKATPPSPRSAAA